jgi:hypothetical protein
MAFFPCEQHGGLYKGAQQTAYPAVLNAHEVLRLKRRLCPPCFTELEEWCESFLSVAGNENGMGGCCVCGSEDAPDSIFVTLYAHKAERVDHWGRACAEHSGSDVREALFRVPAGVQPPLPVPE